MPKNSNNNGAHSHGFTLIEVVIVIAIIGTLSSIAVPNYIGYRYRAQVAAAVAEISMIETAIINYAAENDGLPDTLSDLNANVPNDPWGRPYQYLKIEGAAKGKKGHQRKDHFLVPVNSDFDLYSLGKDGKSSPPFTAKGSRDDIVRANNGGYKGLASEY